MPGHKNEDEARKRGKQGSGDDQLADISFVDHASCKKTAQDKTDGEQTEKEAGVRFNTSFAGEYGKEIDQKTVEKAAQSLGKEGMNTFFEKEIVQRQ